jgi:Xaa-Pro aminopeptidase
MTNSALLMHADSVRDSDLFVATGVAITDPFCYLEHGSRRVILTSTLEADAARRNSLATDVLTNDVFGIRELLLGGMDWDAAEMEVIARLLEREHVAQVTVPPRFPLATADFLRGRGVEVAVDTEQFEDRRRAKGEHALAGMRLAQHATEQAFARVRELLGGSSPGRDGLLLEGELLTCERLRHEINTTLRVHGCGGEEPIASAGPQGANVHEHGEGPVRPGESVIVDIFPQHLATRYCADMTRTFCFGPAPEWLAHMHVTVYDALRRSTEAIEAGVAGRAVYDVACDVIEAAGYRTSRTAGSGEALDEDFFHGLGHGVGVDVHEAPGMGLGSSSTLRAGDVVTNEPGVYRKRLGGVRLEDLLLVTEGGCENLTSFDYELEVTP